MSPAKKKNNLFSIPRSCSISNIFHSRNFRFLSWKLFQMKFINTRLYNSRKEWPLQRFIYYLLVMKLFVSCAVTLRNRDVDVMICRAMFSIKSFLLFLFKLIWFVPGCKFCLKCQWERKRHICLLEWMDICVKMRWHEKYTLEINIFLKTFNKRFMLSSINYRNCAYFSITELLTSCFLTCRCKYRQIILNK